MTKVYVTEADKLYDLNFTLRDSTGVAIDLTNATLSFLVQDLASSTLKFTGTMSIVSATAGTCKYTVQATDFDTPGQYDASIVANYVGGKKITFDDIQVVVKPNLPK